MIYDKKALECAETLIKFCNQQKGCQNCIFREHGGDHWECNIGFLYDDLRNAKSNYQAKRTKNGYID